MVESLHSVALVYIYRNEIPMKRQFFSAFHYAFIAWSHDTYCSSGVYDFQGTRQSSMASSFEEPFAN